MVYTDGVHLVADSLIELHQFARKIGLKKEWFQDKRIPHYDLTTTTKRLKAIGHGAALVTERDIVKRRERVD